jgi:lysophospholipase L1-like esterase
MRLPLFALVLSTVITHSLSGAEGGTSPGAEGGAQAAKFVQATDSPIVYEGRTLATADGTVRMGFPGIVIHLRFQGDALSIRLNAAMDDEYVDIGVDGAEPTRLQLRKGEGDYPLVSNGAGLEHRVEVTRRTESWQGEMSVLGLTLGPNDRLLQPDPLPERRLMFIGDSITCGEASDVAPNDPIKDNRMSNGRLSYGKVLARRFNAQCHLVSYGGRGVFRDWQGITAIANAPQFYELALPDDPKSTWDPHAYVADAIGILLGTNDFSRGVPDQVTFVNAYVQFVQKVRHDAPKAHIFLISSPIFQDAPGQVPNRTVLFRFIEQVAAEVGSPLVTAVDIAHQPGRPGNGHPTAAQQLAMADELEPLFRRALGW